MGSGRQRVSRRPGATRSVWPTRQTGLNGNRFHLAQVNIGRLRAPIDDPTIKGFRSQLDPINALADRSLGFVWRLQTSDGDGTAIRPFPDDDLIVINMSVWESL